MRFLRNIGKFIFTVAMWIFIALLTTLLLLLILLLIPFEKDQRLSHRIPNFWGYLICKVNPLWKVNLIDLDLIDKNQGFVIVANHTSFADIICLHLLQRHFKWVAKDSLFRIPVIGWVMSLVSYIPLERNRHGSIKSTFKEATKWLRKDISVLIFPEGTRSSGSTLGKFKNGAFKLAIEAQKPIIPVLIVGSDQINEKGSWLLSPRMNVTIRVFEPVPTEGLIPADFAQLRDSVHGVLAENYAELRDKESPSAQSSLEGDTSLPARSLKN
ncbi:MAG: 1-acyl-sn-glycerol-3-phosphate acyltransferase [Gammaproteobacteria bacterium]|nr:1-acyl-sn-glycerol-3-phosphate acyltransferase [Gammaproteobacteria bacterium]